MILSIDEAQMVLNEEAKINAAVENELVVIKQQMKILLQGLAELKEKGEMQAAPN